MWLSHVAVPPNTTERTKCLHASQLQLLRWPRCRSLEPDPVQGLLALKPVAVARHAPSFRFMRRHSSRLSWLGATPAPARATLRWGSAPSLASCYGFDLSWPRQRVTRSPGIERRRHEGA